MAKARSRRGCCNLPIHALDHMERPTSALQLSRVTLCLRELNAEPHTKEVGRDAVYYYHCLRSARGDDRGGALARAEVALGDELLVRLDDDATRQVQLLGQHAGRWQRRAV